MHGKIIKVEFRQLHSSLSLSFLRLSVHDLKRFHIRIVSYKLTGLFSGSHHDSGI